MRRLSQRIAIVTGGGRGIGRGIVLELAKAGADVAIADLDLRGAERTAGEVASLGREVIACELDVTDTLSVVPHFRERGGGKIVNIASIAGRRGDNGLAPYSASKAAAISLTQSMAFSLGPHGINVNAVCPGLLWTPMWEKLEGMFRRNADPDAVGERATFDAYIRANCPLRREQTPEDIGHAVVFLVSEQARNITGQALNVDGGMQMS